MRSYLLAVSFFVACGLFAAFTEARYIKRNAELTICSRSTPCAWQVYNPYVRTTVTFVSSPCVCPSENRCTRSGDDISISAYVYRCVPNGVEVENYSFNSSEE